LFFQDDTIVAEPLERSGYATKEDFETLKRMIESLARKLDEQQVARPAAKTYQAKPRKRKK
jgi:hypothetical protein